MIHEVETNFADGIIIFIEKDKEVSVRMDALAGLRVLMERVELGLK